MNPIEDKFIHAPSFSFNASGILGAFDIWFCWQSIGFGFQQGVHYVRVGQGMRLNNCVIELHMPANQAIFSIKCQVSAVNIHGHCSNYVLC